VKLNFTAPAAGGLLDPATIYFLRTTLVTGNSTPANTSDGAVVSNIPFTLS